MKKNLGVVQAVYPMPVLMVAAYDENGKVNAMNAAWGMICNEDRIALFIDEDHKTTQNLLKTKGSPSASRTKTTWKRRISSASPPATKCPISSPAPACTPGKANL